MQRFDTTLISILITRVSVVACFGIRTTLYILHKLHFISKQLVYIRTFDFRLTTQILNVPFAWKLLCETC